MGCSLTEAWSVAAGVHHNWGNSLTSSLWGMYGDFNYSDAVATAIYGAGADMDWQYYQIGSRTIWQAAPTLAFSLEIVYNNVNGANRLLAADGTVDWFQGDIRVQRNFYP